MLAKGTVYRRRSIESSRVAEHVALFGRMFMIPESIYKLYICGVVVMVMFLEAPVKDRVCGAWRATWFGLVVLMVQISVNNVVPRVVFSCVTDLYTPNCIDVLVVLVS